MESDTWSKNKKVRGYSEDENVIVKLLQITVKRLQDTNKTKYAYSKIVDMIRASHPLGTKVICTIPTFRKTLEYKSKHYLRTRNVFLGILHKV